ncbi:MAG: DUF1622 domain-containing protein [Caldilineae bacterium]|nr:DUF1622 domain-containing protein [Anaerolineae bacterium]MCB0203830.1 DUF1622 domain-containing protein [Anaerolineae bacterium]MCB0253463.1 DUF1622 domain-containing protein [Anaerolineae bacterium]MCB9154537.1 DUF1622 domain-containing protein [Caldilineae bacterium]
MLAHLIGNSSEGAAILQWIEAAAIGIEILAVAIIVIAILYSTTRYLYQVFRRQNIDDRYDIYRASLGRSLLLGLEILVAADVVRTVALEATLESVVILGMLVLIRIFLSWSLVVEIEGRWPWRPKLDPEKQPTKTIS